MTGPPSNNSMHPTRNGAPFILNLLGGRVMPGVSPCVILTL